MVAPYRSLPDTRTSAHQEGGGLKTSRVFSFNFSLHHQHALA